MLVIRLQRIGRRHQPGYRLVVAEKRSKLGGPPTEDLGSYNSFSKALGLNKERILYWLKIGARVTPTVHNLLVKGGVISAPKKPIKTRRKADAEAAKAAPAAPIPEAAAAKEVF